MDIITSHMAPRRRAALEAISGIITVVVMAIVVYMLMAYAWQRTLTMETTTTNHLPMWPFRWCYSFGMLCTTLTVVVETIDAFRIALGKKVIRTKEELDMLLSEGGEEA